MELTPYESRILKRAKRKALVHTRSERDLVLTLQDIMRSDLLTKLDVTSPFAFCVKTLKMSDGMAYAITWVARKGMRFPQIQRLLESGELTVARAARFVAHVTDENVAELVFYALSHTLKEINAEMARQFPHAACRAFVKIVGINRVRFHFEMTDAQFADFLHSQDLIANLGKPADTVSVLAAGLQAIINKYDKVKRAERAMKRKKNAAKPCANKDSGANIPSETNHLVNLRDKGGCVHVSADGVRCGQTRFVERHHIKFWSEGGDHSLKNLATLCTFHHGQVHKMGLDMNQ